MKRSSRLRYPPAPSGFIESELAWGTLFEALLRLPGGRRDPESLVEWATQEPGRRRIASLSDEMRRDLGRAVAETAGALAGRIFEAAGRGTDVLAIGLVARVLYGPEAKGDEAAIRASGRLESHVGVVKLEETVALGWADAAEAVLERRLTKEEPSKVQPLIAAGDALLASIGATESAHRSRYLGTSQEHRRARFAEELSAFLEGKGEHVPASLRAAGDRVLEHALARHDAARSERIEMALRLAHWLAMRRVAGDTKPASFADAARGYRQDEGFVDWARTRIWDGDSLAALGQAYTRLAGASGSGMATSALRSGGGSAKTHRT